MKSFSIIAGSSVNHKMISEAIQLDRYLTMIFTNFRLKPATIILKRTTTFI